MTLGESNRSRISNRKQNVCSKTKYKLTIFAVISNKPVDIVFKQTIDNIEEVNQSYVTP